MKKKNQENCEHTRCEVLGEETYDYSNSTVQHSGVLVHLRCRECWKYFGRDDWKRRKFQRWEQDHESLS